MRGLTVSISGWEYENIEKELRKKGKELPKRTFAEWAAMPRAHPDQADDPQPSRKLLPYLVLKGMMGAVKVQIVQAEHVNAVVYKTSKTLKNKKKRILYSIAMFDPKDNVCVNTMMKLKDSMKPKEADDNLPLQFLGSVRFITDKMSLKNFEHDLKKLAQKYPVKKKKGSTRKAR